MIYRQTALYKFLIYCNDSNLERLVVDCGAGGDMPPLGLFYSEGYKTIGIELSDIQMDKAKEFESLNNMELNIMKGDMRKLPFGDEEIPYIYSFGSIFHMSKREVKETIEEIKRVLCKDGLCYINLLSTDDFRYGEGMKIGDGEFIQLEDGEELLHSYFTEEEGDNLFEDMTILYKEKRVFNRIYKGKFIKQGAIDYILRK